MKSSKIKEYSKILFFILYTIKSSLKYLQMQYDAAMQIVTSLILNSRDSMLHLNKAKQSCILTFDSKCDELSTLQMFGFKSVLNIAMENQIHHCKCVTE